MKDCTYVTPGAFAIATFKAPSKGGGRGGRPKRKLERGANTHTYLHFQTHITLATALVLMPVPWGTFLFRLGLFPINALTPP